MSKQKQYYLRIFYYTISHLFLFNGVVVYAQSTTDLGQNISFLDASLKMPTITFKSWLQKGVGDMNNDGLDDIVRANTQGYFFILKQQTNGSFSEDSLGQIQSTTPLSVVLGDVDNNGFNDILTGGQYNGVRLVKIGNSISSNQVLRLPSDLIFTQASAMADINNDGWLDVFVCNDDSTNAVWKNTQNGNFIRDDMGFDFYNIPREKHAGNYGIVFTDFDNDGDIDAYISKCKAGVEDSTDQRRVNQLFVNENGIYKDQASKFGMADGRQSWVTDFQDIDNDGDLDAFIANHHAPSRLMLNDGHGYFTDITANAGFIDMPDGILQAILRDFDNDGYADLIVSGMHGAKMYHNNGNLTFSSWNFPLLNLASDIPLRSFALGDLNHDGFLDIYASYYYGNPDADKLWLNTKNNNHFLSITLVGKRSNRSAIGSKIILTANGQQQIREIRAGESYGISNTLTQIFGLGLNTHIDKIEINWPSGLKTTLNNPTIDTYLSITEPNCSESECLKTSAKILR